MLVDVGGCWWMLVDELEGVMGFRDDFYRPEHIVGYTGSLEDQPTVYFWQKTAVMMTGRITQKYPNRNHIGRSIVMEHKEYYPFHLSDYANPQGIGFTPNFELGAELLRLYHTSKYDYFIEVYEHAGIYKMHKSRTIFTLIGVTSSHFPLTLINAIARFPDIKVSAIKYLEPETSV